MRRRLRLRRAEDYKLLSRHGQRWHHPLLLLITRANELEFSRFGFSVNRKFGKATERNRIKRRLREIVRKKLPQIRHGWDCLFIARQGANGASYSELETAANLLLKRSKLLRNGHHSLNPSTSRKELM